MEANIMEKRCIDPFSENKAVNPVSEVKDDSVSMGSSDFVKLERDGKMEYRRKGYEDVELPAPEPREPLKKTKKQLRDERRAKQTAKK